MPFDVPEPGTMYLSKKVQGDVIDIVKHVATLPCRDRSAHISEPSKVELVGN